MQDKQIGFIGAGNMAGSLIQGLLARGHAPERLLAADIDAERLAPLLSKGIREASAEEIARQADMIVLAVKPQVMASICRELKPGPQQPLLVSIAAGITLEQMQGWLGEPAAIVRCMPNTPALVGMGASGLFANERVSAAQRTLAQDLLDAVGMSEWVKEESALDLVTAVSGSGPAYFFLFMESMQQAAMELGMDREQARALVLQTAAGAARLAGQQDEELSELRRRVTSPGGTTERAIETFREGDLEGLVARAIRAARDRAVELAEESAAD